MTVYGPKRRRRVLDLFCGAGGAAMGYARAGYEVVGVDIEPQPNFPFAFIQADALEPPVELSDFDLVHASPPCEPHTRARHLRDAQGHECSTVDMVAETREMLEASGVPYVIENVPDAPLKAPLKLCGSMFGLGVRRHRLFECSRFVMSPSCDHKAQGTPVGVYHRMNDDIPGGGTTARDLDEAQQAMDARWMTWGELKESIPPAYTEYIGNQLREDI